MVWKKVEKEKKKLKGRYMLHTLKWLWLGYASYATLQWLSVVSTMTLPEKLQKWFQLTFLHQSANGFFFLPFILVLNGGKRKMYIYRERIVTGDYVTYVVCLVLILLIKKMIKIDLVLAVYVQNTTKNTSTKIVNVKDMDCIFHLLVQKNFDIPTFFLNAIISKADKQFCVFL